jgi:hypothetical protein
MFLGILATTSKKRDGEEADTDDTRGKKVNVKIPAIGRNASSAWAEVWMSAAITMFALQSVVRF